jgi:hypothetical protein
MSTDQPAVTIGAGKPVTVPVEIGTYPPAAGLKRFHHSHPTALLSGFPFHLQ